MTGLSQINLQYSNNVPGHTQQTVNIQKPESPTVSDEPDKNRKKKLKLALAAAAAAGIAAIAIGAGVRHKFNIGDAKKFFDKYIQTTNGNNKIIDQSINETKDAADKFIAEHSDVCEKIKEYITGVVEPKQFNDVTPDGFLYHGTSVETAKEILGSGITPYASKTASNKMPGLGRGVYTTPTLDLAKYYSEDGVILPYKIDGQVGSLKVDLDEFRANVAYMISEGMEPDALASSLFGRHFSKETREKAMEYAPDVINKVMKGAGYNGLYTPAGMTKGLLSGAFGNLPENIDTAGQIAVYDGAKLVLDIDKLKELNPITKENYFKFRL